MENKYFPHWYIELDRFDYENTLPIESHIWRFDYENTLPIESHIWRFDYENTLPIENCIPMTRNALSIEAVGRRANNALLPHSIQAWDNDCPCWSNKVIEEQLDQRHPSKLERYCVGCWPGLFTDRYLPHLLNSHQRQIPRGTLNSSALLANRAHG